MTMTDAERIEYERKQLGVDRQFFVIAAFMTDEVQPTILARSKDSRDRDELDEAVFGIHTRATSWSHTLSKLADVTDIQCHATACRALLEMAIDLALLVDGEDVARLREWEKLAVTRSVNEQLITNEPLPPEADIAAFYAFENISMVGAPQFFTKFEQNGWLPNRWTEGRTLLDDAIRVDAKRPQLRLGALTANYFRPLCWLTHGSGLLFLRTTDIEKLEILSRTIVMRCAQLAKVIVALTLEHFGVLDDSWRLRIAALKDRDLTEAGRLIRERRGGTT